MRNHRVTEQYAARKARIMRRLGDLPALLLDQEWRAGRSTPKDSRSEAPTLREQRFLAHDVIFMSSAYDLWGMPDLDSFESLRAVPASEMLAKAKSRGDYNLFSDYLQSDEYQRSTIVLWQKHLQGIPMRAQVTLRDFDHAPRPMDLPRELREKIEETERNGQYFPERHRTGHEHDIYGVIAYAKGGAAWAWRDHEWRDDALDALLDRDVPCALDETGHVRTAYLPKDHILVRTLAEVAPAPWLPKPAYDDELPIKQFLQPHHLCNGETLHGETVRIYDPLTQLDVRATLSVADAKPMLRACKGRIGEQYTFTRDNHKIGANKLQKLLADPRIIVWESTTCEHEW